MQTKLESLIEQVLNVFSGLILSIFVIQPIVFKFYNIELSMSENIGMAVIFTTVSIIRGYFWRRLYNRQSMKKILKEINGKGN